ncbi:hypothetical protein SAMN06265182_1874 [Persephonella hydrogeniphila]|uniref:DUF302 domain-containing protein n=1 Tax=Persephonella hydrogeniphila TaxID=198703 RepID=A0A285NLZ9_9AQUI|nr:hypothetical protein [Persephonella hydrogeniphila]SNZ10530.1 hypothetical protein SAMN06265182_1874 [Persephonella hydrogeniphila]
MNRNWPFIIITGAGILATFIFLYIFVYGLAVNTVKSAALLEKAYPHVKPQEYMNIFKREAKANNLKIIKISEEDNLFLIQIIDEKQLEDVIALAPQIAPLAVVNLVVYDLGDGTGVVGNNPYIWDILIDNSKIDEMAEDFSNRLSDILDSIYWKYKKEKEMLK